MRTLLHGMVPQKQRPHHIEWHILYPLHHSRFVGTSAAEAELSALFLNCTEGMIFQLTLKKLGHPQAKTPIHCNNATDVSIANNTVKQLQSRSMEMQYF
jgi:hypothetical protein